MASHGPSDWIRKERRRLARLSAQLVNPPSDAELTAALPKTVGPYGNQHDEFSIPDLLLKGTTMTKISEKKQKKAQFHLDPDEGRIIYQSSKTGIGTYQVFYLLLNFHRNLCCRRVVSVETIKEIRSGSNARYYRAQFAFPEEVENRWITIIYILEGTYKTLHMLAETHEVFQMWDASLRKLLAIRQGLMSGLGNVEMRQTVWERQYWKGADQEGDQKLSFEEVERLCKRLNAILSTKQLKVLFDVRPLRITFVLFYFSSSPF